jgi:hypothetical protein
MSNLAIPRASIIAIYADAAQFTKTTTLKGAAAAANSFVGLMASQMNDDPIGGERFITVRESPSTSGRFNSLHNMFFDGSGEGQNFHFHPPAEGNRDSSIRHVLLYALATVDPNSGSQKDRTTFEWFDIQDPVVSHQAYERDSWPVTKGNPVSPRYKLELTAGQVALLSFGAGIHRFGGDGGAMAISLHPLDINSGSSHGSFLGNTSAYEGQVPENVVLIKPSMPDGILSEACSALSLQDLFSAHSGIARKTLEGRRPGKLPRKAERAFVKSLRAAAGYPLPEPLNAA